MKTPLDLQVFLKDILKLMVANGGVGRKESHAIGFSPVFTLSQLQNFLDLNDVKIKKEERSMTNRRRRNGQPLINVKTKIKSHLRNYWRETRQLLHCKTQLLSPCHNHPQGNNWRAKKQCQPQAPNNSVHGRERRCRTQRNAAGSFHDCTGLFSPSGLL